MTVATVPSPTSLLLRSCGAGFTAHGGFVWSSTVGATVRPVRWDPAAVCGDGLHGFLHGEGSGDLADWSESAEWLVIETPTADIVHLDGKVKCPVTTVAHVGQGATAFDRRLDAIAFLVSRGQCGMGCVGRVLTGGDRSTLTGGYGSTLTGGYGSTLTGGDGSTLTGGYGSTLTGGDHSTLTGGDGSTLTGGDHSTLTGGDHSTLTGGDGSTLTGGDGSTLTGGYGSTLTGGDGSTLTGQWWDGAQGRYRRRLFTVGENGILPNVAYRMDAAGMLVCV